MKVFFRLFFSARILKTQVIFKDRRAFNCEFFKSIILKIGVFTGQNKKSVMACF